MMKIIVSIFTIYQVSLGNRLLLQGGPPAPPVAPVQLPPVVPLNPPPQALPPQQPVPVMPPPHAQPPPATPGAPATPQLPVPVQPGPPIQPPPPPPPAPMYPWQQYPGGVPQTSMMLECTISPPAVTSCAGKTKNVVNPMEGFEIYCGAMPGSCYQSTLNIGILANGGFLQTIKGIFATSDYAMAGATVFFLNQRSEQIYIEKVMCDKAYSCAGLTIVLGQNMVLEAGSVFCPGMGSCDGCVVKQGPFDIGEPCSKYAEPI